MGVIQHPEDAGIMMDEGAELEDALGDDELPWFVEQDEEDLALDDQEIRTIKRPYASSQCEIVVAPELGDKPEEVAEAEVSTRRLQLLKRLRGDMRAARVPHGLFAVTRELSDLERELRARHATERQVNMVLRRAVEVHRQKECAALEKALRRAAKRAKQARKAEREARKKAKAKAAADKAVRARMR